MKRSFRFLSILIVLGSLAADAPSTAPIRWRARSTAGVDVAVPSADKVTVIAFLRPGQEQSDDAVKQILDTIGSNPTAIVVSHGHIAADLLDKGQADQAQLEIEQGLKHAPQDANLRVMQVLALLKEKRPDAALSAADQLNSLAPPWQVNLLRAEALIALQ